MKLPLNFMFVSSLLRILIGLISLTPWKVAPAANSIEISGYKIDVSSASESQVDVTLVSLRQQIAIVDALDLPGSVRSFFHSVPIFIDPSLNGMNGQYVQKDSVWLVRVRAGRWPAARAILLHELLHAYHHQILQDAPTVRRAFEEARRSGVYPREFQDSYFLTNAREYFAVVAEIYLSGPSFRAPYRCSAVLKSQPRFIAYLNDIFGKRRCE